MSKSSQKKARVAYDDGHFSVKEQYSLQYWSENLGKWCEIKTFPFVADADNPKDGKNFIHYSLLTEVITLSQQGYALEI